jgi:hypothetical protein
VERIIVVVQVVLERLNQQNHRGNHFLIFIFYFAVDFACNIVRGIIEMILAYNYVSSRRVAAENKTKFSVICRCGFGFHLVDSTGGVQDKVFIHSKMVALSSTSIPK